MSTFSLLFDGIRNGFFVLISYWWIYLPLFLFLGVLAVWKNYITTKYVLGLKWVLLDVKPPPEVFQSPKIAENFFSGLHAVYSKPVKEKKAFFEGKLQDWYTFEIMSHQGDVHFYIRCLETNRNLIESQLFAQYPDAEIELADDYTQQLPKILPDQEHDVFGAELVFTKPNVYPLKTYPFFEEEGAKDQYRHIDPLAPLAEAMSALGPGEFMWLQYVVRPTGDAWTKESEAEIDKIKGKKPKATSPNVLSSLLDVISNLIPGMPADEPKKEDEKEFSIQKLTSGQKFILDQVEAKIAKLAFKVTPRFMYIAKKDVFNRGRTTAVIGMFKQMYSNNLNTFKPNPKTATFTADGWFKWLFPSDKGFLAEQEELERKMDMYKHYRERDFKEVVILNTEEMATLYHLPGTNVQAPFFPRVQAKKGQPPTGLPMK